MDLAPLGLLGVSLPLFLLSTRQIALLWRGLIWLAATGLLAAAAWLAFQRRSYAGLIAALQDAGAHWRHPSDGILAQALTHNWSTVGGAVAPMFGLLFAIATVVALVCLLAFTPGESVEKAVRPVNIALIGAIAGGLLALSISAIGFGGEIRPLIYSKIMQESDVGDGDTIWMGDVSLRLWGIDAPELHHVEQICKARDGAAFPCGQQARDTLRQMIVGKLVSCGPPPRQTPGETQEIAKLRESLGRPIVACSVHTRDQTTDIEEVMALSGSADSFGSRGKSSDRIRANVEIAKQAHIGMWAGWTLTPDDWRNDKQCREQFVSATIDQLASLDSRVACEKLSDNSQGGGAGASNTPPAPK